MKTYIHIGLHKTGSTAIQNIFENNFINSDVIYNPNELIELLEKSIDFEKSRDLNIEKTKNKFLDIKRSNRYKTLFISNENISQRFCMQDYEICSRIIKKIFDDARILLFLRYQTDWILSCYKQAIQLGDVQHVTSFLQFNGSGFGDSSCRFNKNNLLTINIHKADWANLIKCYTKFFEKSHLFIFFYENLKNDFENEIKRIGDIIGVELTLGDRSKQKNISYSALACYATIYLHDIFRFFNLENLLQKNTKLYFEEISYELDENNRSADYIITWEEAKKTKPFFELIPIFYNKLYIRVISITWRKLWQWYLDRIIYFDWDLLKSNSLRFKLDSIFKKKNQELLTIIDKNTIPQKYIK